MAAKAAAKKTAAPARRPAPAEEPPATGSLQAMFDEAHEKGYFGISPDPTPRENYTLLTPADAPTPETDAKAKADALDPKKVR